MIFCLVFHIAQFNQFLHAGGSREGGGGLRGPAEEMRGSGGGQRGPPANSAPGHRAQGALGIEERGFRGGRSYSNNQR